LSDGVESLEGAVLFFLGKMLLSIPVEWIWYSFTLTTLVADVVHVAFVISLCAGTRHSHGLSLKVFTVEALGVLLSPDVCDLLTKEALVVGSVPSIIMWAPELEVRVLCSCLVNVLASWLMESREVKCDHDVLTSFSLAILVSF
jgi:hypothetical protein